MTKVGARFIEPVKKTDRINLTPTIVQEDKYEKISGFCGEPKRTKLTKGGEGRI